jgi:hypothetical protein
MVIEASSRPSRAADEPFQPFRALLFEREPSGLFQVRCLAARALARLEAYDVLIEFVEAPRDATDPVERLGEDAGINAAARAVATVREPRVFDLLIRLAETRPLPGVIGALRAFSRIEATPYLISRTRAAPRPKRRCEISARLRTRRWPSPRADACPSLSARANPACGSGEARRRSGKNVARVARSDARPGREDSSARVQNLSNVRPGAGRARSYLSLDQHFAERGLFAGAIGRAVPCSSFQQRKELIAATVRVVDSAPNDRTRRVLLNVKALSQNERASDALSAGLS